MAWVRLDDQMPEHPKFDALSDSAFRLHIHGLCYCARQLTDGVIKSSRAQRLMDTDDAEDLIWELIGAGLWEAVEGGYVIHDYLSYNPSRESIQKKRAATAKRQQAFRDRHVTDEETEPVSNASRNAVTNTSPVPSRPVPLDQEIDEGVLGGEGGAKARVVACPSDIDPRVFEVLDVFGFPRSANNVKYVGLKIVEHPGLNPVSEALETKQHIAASKKPYKRPLVTWANWMKNSEKPPPWAATTTTTSNSESVDVPMTQEELYDYIAKRTPDHSWQIA